MLKKGPAGFPKDFEHLEEIKYKHFIFSKNYQDTEILQKISIKRWWRITRDSSRWSII